MAIKIVKREYKSRVQGTCKEYCEILADTEADITALSAVVDDGTLTVTPEPGSVAYTADMTAVYQLSPSGVWTKAEV